MNAVVRLWNRLRGRHTCADECGATPVLGDLQTLNGYWDGKPGLNGSIPRERIPDMLATAHCPDCAGRTFYQGPEGGGSINIMCAGCGARFCWAWPFTPMRIDNNPSLYRDKPQTIFELGGWKP